MILFKYESQLYIHKCEPSKYMKIEKLIIYFILNACITKWKKLFKDELPAIRLEASQLTGHCPIQI